MGPLHPIGTIGESYDQRHGRIGHGTLQDRAAPQPRHPGRQRWALEGLDDLEIATCAWVSWFNEERLHSELDDATPTEFEPDYRHRSQPDW